MRERTDEKINRKTKSIRLYLRLTTVGKWANPSFSNTYSVQSYSTA